MPDISLRILSSDDAAAWRRLRLQALEGDPEAFGATIEAHQKLTDEDIRARIGCDMSDRFIVGAFAESELIGTAGLARERGLKERHKALAWGVYVQPAYRGQGVGRRMMALLLEHARKIDGLEQVIITVATGQKAAMALYRSLGFLPFGLEPRALKVNGRYIDEEHLWLPLG